MFCNYAVFADTEIVLPVSVASNRNWSVFKEYVLLLKESTVFQDRLQV